MNTAKICLLLSITAAITYAGLGMNFSFAEEEVIHLEDANAEIADDYDETDKAAMMSAKATITPTESIEKTSAPRPHANESQTNLKSESQSNAKPQKTNADKAFKEKSHQKEAKAKKTKRDKMK